MKRGIVVEATMKKDADGASSSTSSNSSSSSSSSSRSTGRPTTTPNVSRLRVEQLFPSRQEFTTAVRLQLMEQEKGWKVEKGGARQAAVRCASHDRDPVTKVHKGCGFRITACKQTRGGGGNNTTDSSSSSSSNSDVSWKVTSVVDKHVNCSGKGPPRGPGVAEIRAAGHPIISNNPNITATALQKMIKVQTGIDVHVRTANRLIKRTNSDALPSADERAEGFQYLGSYLEELAENSGATITDVKWTEDGRFDKCFVMLGQSAHVAACSPQQAFSTECCRLKGHWDGVLLCLLLTVKDAEDKTVIVAFAVGPVEKTDDVYRYMFMNVKRNNEMAAWVDKETTTCYFADGFEGSAAAAGIIAGEFPRAEPRRCLKHLISSVTPSVGEECTKHIFNAARAPSSASFHHYMDRLKALKPDSYVSLMKYPHDWWANYACRRNVTWGRVATNAMTSEESANDVIGEELRVKPVFEFVKGVVELVATRLHEASQLRIDRPEELFTAFAEGRLSAELSCSQEFKIKTTSQGIHMVAPLLSNDQSRLEHRVRLVWGGGDEAPSMRCTCGYPARWEMPCCHVMAVCDATNKLNEVRALVGDGFKLANYRAAAFTPALAVATPVWSELTRDATRKEPPLRLHRAGRPKKKTRKETKRVASVGGPATAASSSKSCYQARVSVDPGVASAAGSKNVGSVSTKASAAGSRIIVDLSQD